MKNIAIVSRKWKSYQTAFNQATDLHAHFNLVYAGADAPSTPQQSLHDLDVKVIIGNPNIAASYIDQCPQLEWFQSSWAGNNSLQNCQSKHYTLTGVKGVFAQQMSEYVMAYLLYFARNIEGFNTLKQQHTWQQLERFSLGNKTLGILGLGNIGMSVAKTAQSFNMSVIGLRQNAGLANDITCYASHQKLAFAQQCDYILNLLPDTAQTNGFCDLAFFNSMRKGSVFINAGRGNAIDKPKSIIQVLENGHLKAAVLDVFETEPLPQQHPYYTTDNMYISCHTAAVSDPFAVFEVFHDNAKRYLNNEPLAFVHDFNTGY